MKQFFLNINPKILTIILSFFAMLFSLSYKLISKDKLSKKIFWTQFLWGLSVVFFFMPAIDHYFVLHITYNTALTWFITFLPNIFIRFVLEKFGVKNEDIEKEL